MNIAKIKQNKGYTLLFAVLVSSLVLVVGVSILTISKKEFLLSASERDSTQAIYAANGALECFAKSDINAPAGGFNDADISCGENMSVPAVDTVSSVHTLSFFAKMGKGSLDQSCASVLVTKQLDITGVKWITTIDSRGYNMGWDSNNENCGLKSAKKVERAIRLTY